MFSGRLGRDTRGDREDPPVRNCKSRYIQPNVIEGIKYLKYVTLLLVPRGVLSKSTRERFRWTEGKGGPLVPSFPGEETRRSR